MDQLAIFRMKLAFSISIYFVQKKEITSEINDKSLHEIIRSVIKLDASNDDVVLTCCIKPIASPDKQTYHLQ